VSLQTFSSTAVNDNPLMSGGPQNGTLNVVAFQLDRQVYTLPIKIIRQIMDMVYLTRLPEVSESIEGIFNYHGTTVPVVDLRRYLSLPKLPIQLHTPIMLVTFRDQLIGLIVDKVIGVISQSQSSIFLRKELLPDNFGEISILDGVIQNSHDYMLMLNLEQLFTSQRKIDLIQAIDQFASSLPSDPNQTDQSVPAEPVTQEVIHVLSEINLPLDEPLPAKKPKARKKSANAKHSVIDSSGADPLAPQEVKD
jgi:purine-binding chemotaxis protein CheW